MKHLTLEDLLSRVNLQISLNQVASQIIENFDLGELITISPMFVGYEELNSLLETSRGKFVVKIFSKNKDLETIESNVRSIDNYYRGNVPVPKMYKDKSGKFIYQIRNNPAAYLIVMDYFEGKKFIDVEPTLHDVVNLTEILSRIHNLSFETNANYDMWLTIYLVEQFDEKKGYLDPEDLALIEPVINEFRKINYEKLSQSIVHFDLHRENVMKDKNGNYCVLDLATCTYNYTAFDIATFISLFCLDSKKPLEENINIYKEVIKTYRKYRSLNEYEVEIMPLLIKGTFASNLLISSYVQKTDQDDNPEQTLYYKSLGSNGLILLKDWKNTK